MGALHTYQMATLKVGTETVKYIQKKSPVHKEMHT